MKKENSFGRNPIMGVLLPGVIVLLLIYLFLHQFSRQVDYQMTKMTTERLEDVNVQSINAVRTELNRVLREVAYTAEFLSKTPELSEEARYILYDQLRKNCGFASVRLVSSTGALYSSENQPLLRSAGDYVEKICAGKSGLTDVFLSGITGDSVFAFYAPVKHGETVKGGIAGIMAVDRVVEMAATKSFHSESDTFVLKPDGTVVMQTGYSDSLFNNKDYFRFLNDETDLGAEGVEKLRSGMERGESGTLMFTGGKEKKIVYYAPAEINDWYVTTMVPYTVSNWYRERINMTALYLTMKIVLLFLAQMAVLLLWSRRTKNIILDSRADLELEKKKLELALLHSTGTTFEYVQRDDSFTFITPPVIKDVEFPPVMKEISVNGASLGLVDSEDLEKWRSALKKAAEGVEPEPLEIAGGASFSEETYFRLTVTPVIVGKEEMAKAIGTLEDITEERRIKRRFAQEEQYRAALLSEAIAMWSVDIVKLQVMACTIYGKDRLKGSKSFVNVEKFIQKMCRYVHPADRERIGGMMQINNMLAAYYTGKREFRELFRATYPKSEEYKWMTYTISLLTEPVSGNPVAFAYIRDVNEETEKELELTYSSERDPLTGLYNRRNIAEKVELALKNKDSLSCLIMMDLDGFKEINDRFGHQEGDAILKKMAHILTGAFRADDIIVRFGGDEFIVFLDHLPNRECAESRAEEVRRQTCALPMEGEAAGVSISIGIAFGPQDGNTFDLLYKHADEALYMAKGWGKNQIAFYGEEEEQIFLERPD